MAAISGTTGNVSLSGAVGLIKSWTANVAPAEIDITAFGSVGKRRLHGILDITGTIVATMDNGSSPLSSSAWFVQTAAGATATLTAETDNSIAFNALIRSADISVDVNGEATVTYNYQLNAPSAATSYGDCVTVTWA
jgi:hypothetical protein